MLPISLTPTGEQSDLRMVIDALPSLISYVDRDLRYRFMNRQYAEWFHRPPEYFHGKTMYEILPGEIYDTIRQEVARALKGETVVFEREVHYEFDPPRYIKATYVPDKAADGEVRGFVVVVEDHTAERNARKSLRNNEQRYRGLVEASSQHVWISDPSGGSTDEQLAWWVKLTGQSPDASRGWGWLEAVHVDDRRRVKEEWTRVSQERKPLEIEYRIRLADGTYHLFFVHGIPIFNDDGTLREWVGTSTDISTRREAEDALRKSEERFRRIVETAAEGIWTLDSQGLTTFVNDRLAQMLGRKAEDMRGHSAFDFVAPEDGELALSNFTLVHSDALAPHEIRLLRWDGAPLWTNVAASSLRDANGAFLGVLAMVTDISERKKAEEAQQAIERQLTLLIEASGTLLESPASAAVLGRLMQLARRLVEADAYCVWRRATGSGAWYIAAVDGLSPNYQSTLLDQMGDAEEIGAEPIVLEDIERIPFRSDRSTAYREEGIRSLIVAPLRIHGETAGTVVFYYRSPHRFSDFEIRVASALGNLAAAALSTAELYERETKLRKAAEVEERQAHFLAEASQMLASSLNYEATLNAVVDLAVPSFADLASISIIDDSGETHPVAVKHIDPPKMPLFYEYQQRFGSSENSATKMVLKTGRPLLVEDITSQYLAGRAQSEEQLQFLRDFHLSSLILAPLIASGRPIGTLAFVTLDSGRRYSKSDLALAEELARRAATAVENARLFTQSEAAQRALQRSNEELQRANEDLHQFAHSASHDLQEPLRMVAVYSQMLERRYKGVLDAEADQFIDYAVQGARRMEMLVRDLLAYTQAVNIDESAIEPVDVGEVANQALANLRTAILESGASVELDPLPAIRIAPAHLLQLFQNLIGNALKYRSDAAPPSIKISSERRGKQWEIRVQDNGIGIEPQYASQVFGLFKRLHAHDKYAGTGIGLAICQKIVERYGGRIWVEAGNGPGSMFCFTLPAAESAGGDAR